MFILARFNSLIVTLMNQITKALIKYTFKKAKSTSTSGYLKKTTYYLGFAQVYTTCFTTTFVIMTLYGMYSNSLAKLIDE